MNLSLALATAALLAAEPTSLPAGHPPVPPGTQASPATSPLPQGHPPVDGAAAAPSGELPAGHPPTSGTGRLPPSADELLRQLDSTEGLREKEKTFEIASSLGRLYYVNGRNADALAYLQQAEAKARPTRELFLAERKKLGKKPVPTAEAAGCGFKPGMALEDMGAAARERAKKGDAAGAAACARAALEPALEAEVMRAHALVLVGETDPALEVYAGVLAVEPLHEEALYSRSALLFETRGEDLASLKQARAGFDAMVAAHPGSSRAPMARRLSALADETVKAGGRRKLLASRAEDRRIRLSQSSAAQAAGPRPLTQEMVDAVQNTERTPELEQGLAKLVDEGEEHLAKGRYQEALANYTRVVPFQPENGRAKAGMAWALVGLGRPMAARVWGVAVQSDPAAVEKLGDTLKSKGDEKGARALWQKLASDAPDYSGKAGLEAKLGQ